MYCGEKDSMYIGSGDLYIFRILLSPRLHSASSSSLVSSGQTDTRSLLTVVCGFQWLLRWYFECKIYFVAVAKRSAYRANPTNDSRLRFTSTSTLVNVNYKRGNVYRTGAKMHFSAPAGVVRESMLWLQFLGKLGRCGRKNLILS
jgi:hypothetical protein